MPVARVHLTGLRGPSMLSDAERAAVLKHIPAAGRVLEIGTGHGTSVASWARERSGVAFTCIDDFGDGEISDWWANRQKGMSLWAGKVADFARLQPRSRFDVVIVDGDHSEKGCFEDLSLATRVIEPGGAIIAHDYGSPRPQTRGVTPAVDRFCREQGYRVVEHVEWIAVLRKRTVPAGDGQVTTCLLNWRRPRNLGRILDCLAEQSLRPTIFLWNNSPEPFSHPAVDWLVESNRNLVCWPRWWMAQAADSEFAAVMDDDLIPTDKQLLADAVEVARRQPPCRIIGPFGGRMGTRHYSRHDPIHNVKEDAIVDIVKGRFMLLRTADIRQCQLATARSPALGVVDEHEDIAINGMLAGGRLGQHLVPAMFTRRMQDLPGMDGPEAISTKDGHYDRRESARRRWFVDG